MRRLAYSAVAAVACVALAAPAQAQTADDRMVLKFDAPIMVPGATLAPGTYLLRRSDASRDIVQFYNEDETRLMATALTISAERPQPTGDAMLTLKRTSPDLAPALVKVFHPGAVTGFEFVYPEEQARQIAEDTRQIVLSHDAPEGSDMEVLGRARLWRVGPGGQRAEVQRTEGGQRAEGQRAEVRSGQDPARGAARAESAEQHLARIEALIDRMLQDRNQPVGTTGQPGQGQVVVDRAQLEQIKTHLNQLRQELRQQQQRR